jgi:hypothetical protein
MQTPGVEDVKTVQKARKIVEILGTCKKMMVYGGIELTTHAGVCPNHEEIAGMRLCW